MTAIFEPPTENDGKKLDEIEILLPVTSTFNTSNLLPSTSNPSSIFRRVDSRSFLAVATTGKVVFTNNLLVSARPIPREDGEVSKKGLGAIFGRDVVWRIEA